HRFWLCVGTDHVAGRSWQRSKVRPVARSRRAESRRDAIVADRGRGVSTRLPGRAPRPKGGLSYACLVRFPRGRRHGLRVAGQRPQPAPRRSSHESLGYRSFALHTPPFPFTSMTAPLQLAMVGCSHRHTSLAVRERLTFTPEQATDALAAW